MSQIQIATRRKIIGKPTDMAINTITPYWKSIR